MAALLCTDCSCRSTAPDLDREGLGLELQTQLTVGKVWSVGSRKFWCVPQAMCMLRAGHSGPNVLTCQGKVWTAFWMKSKGWGTPSLLLEGV